MAPDKQTLDQLKIHRPSSRSRRSPAPFALILLLLIGIAAGIWWWIGRPKAVLVETVVAERVAAASATAPRTLLNASGYVTARRASTASSKVTGRVTEVLVEEGVEVEEGQIVAYVDASNVEKSLRLAEAQLAAQRSALGETQANLDLAGRELQRIERLAESKITTESELDRARAEVAMLQARLARQRAETTVAEQQLAVWQQQLDDTVIRAPFSGVVVSKNAQPGEIISPLSAGGGFTRTGICTIVDMSSLEVEVDVNESYINRVHAKQPVEITLDSYPDWKIPGKVIAIIPTADRQKATVRVRIAFQKLDPRILPDMGLKVAFQSIGETGATAVEKTPRRAVIVPSAAVRRAGDRDVVWLLHDDRLVRRAVTVESAQNNRTTLAAGLEGGEKVVVAGPQPLVEGTLARTSTP